MNEKYDVIVLGTGLTESILSSLLSMQKRRVLVLDRNNYYGAAIATLSPLKELFTHFKDDTDISAFGSGREWNVDVIPKFLMADGDFVKLLTCANVTRYIEFGSIDCSFVYVGGKIQKVPSTNSEALSSPLLGLFEKRKVANMFQFVAGVDKNDSATYSKVFPPPITDPNHRLDKLFNHFGISPAAQEFVTHAVCLYPDDSFKALPAWDGIKRMQLYNFSVSRFGSSPYLYPHYGLGDLSQGFSRASAVNGGTYMLNKGFQEFIMENGKVVGVRADDEVAYCDAVICDPSYAPTLVETKFQIIRALCLLSHPVKNTSNVRSFQIIMPQRQIGRKHDIYISCVSNQHNVCPKGYYIVQVSTVVETNDPKAEVQKALDLLHPIDRTFYSVSNVRQPIHDGRNNNIYISCDYDECTHVENVYPDAMRIYEGLTGKKFDFSTLTVHKAGDEET